MEITRRIGKFKQYDVKYAQFHFVANIFPDTIIWLVYDDNNVSHRIDNEDTLNDLNKMFVKEMRRLKLKNICKFETK